MKLLTSQLSVAKWHAQIGDPTVADSVLDRLVNAAHNSRVSRCGKREAEGTRMVIRATSTAGDTLPLGQRIRRDIH